MAASASTPQLGIAAQSVPNASDTETTALLNGRSGYGTTQETETGAAGENNVTVNEEEYENPERPKGIKFAILFMCILLGDFFVGYDTSCVATLTPVITDQFQSLSDVAWYGTSYLLASCATVLIYGQLYTFYSMKAIFEISFTVFVIGCVIAAAAPSSAIFILGRALSGLGSAGVFAGGSIIVASTTSLKHRPIYQAFSGGIESIALSAGPLISGAVAHASNWRLSFYIIIPVGVACILSTHFFVHNLQRPENAHLKNKEKLRRLDLTGFAFYVPMMVCLILGLQWAGTEYAWDSWRIILLLILTGVLLIVFLVTEYRAGEQSMFPLTMLRQRSTALSSAFTFCNSAALFVVAYYLPIYFQAIKSASTLDSGLMYLPTALSFAVSVLVAGPATTTIGYYSPLMVLGSVMMIVATGLFTQLSPSTPATSWIAYQIVYGFGCGLAFQQPYTAVQTVLPEARVPTALVTLSFTQEIGGIVALSVSQNVFINRLVKGLTKVVPGLNPKDLLDSGALDIIRSVPEDLRDRVLGVYNDALVDVFYIALGLTCLSLIAGMGIEWKSVKDEKDE